MLESREREGEFAAEFQNGDQLSVSYSSQLERLPVPFRIAPGVTIPVGRYPFQVGTVGFNLGRQRPISGNMSFEFGSFYSGTRYAFSMSQGRVIVTNALAVEPTYSVNKVNLLEELPGPLDGVARDLYGDALDVRQRARAVQQFQ